MADSRPEYTTAPLETACATGQLPRMSDDHRFLILAKDLAEGVGNFADGGVGFDGVEGCGGLCAVAFGAQGLYASYLRALDFGIDAQRGNGTFFFRDEIVNAYYDLFFGFDGALEFVGGFLDFPLDVAGFDAAEHAALGVNFFDIGDRARFNFVGKSFDSVGAGDGIDGIGHTGFVGDDLLRAQGDERSVLC